MRHELLLTRIGVAWHKANGLKLQSMDETLMDLYTLRPWLHGTREFRNEERIAFARRYVRVWERAQC